MKRYAVQLTAGAERDLGAIVSYIAEFDSVASAHHVLDRLMDAVESLATMPERGAYPRELLALGIREYRQVFFKPYRLIYCITDQQVLVHVIVDGRRDIQSLLARRLVSDE